MSIVNFVRYTLTNYLENLTIDEKFINKRVCLSIYQPMCLKRVPSVEKKSLLVQKGCENGCLITFKKIQKEPPEVYY